MSEPMQTNAREAEPAVWAVTSGSYSDYRVVAVCATREIAEAVAGQSSKWSWNRQVESIPILTEVPEVFEVYEMRAELVGRRLVVSTNTHTVVYDGDNGGWERWHRLGQRPDVSGPHHEVADHARWAREQEQYRSRGVLLFRVEGRDSEGVAKAFSDTLARLSPELEAEGVEVNYPSQES